jgi:pimeloyl-ACP methyl ester carboxylesterase
MTAGAAASGFADAGTAWADNRHRGRTLSATAPHDAKLGIRAASPGKAGEAAGVRFARFGAGPPLLLIHPLGGDRVFWEVIVDRLACNRDLILPDLPGHGESPPLPAGNAPTPKRLAAILAALLDELGIDRAHAGGSSVGAWVALELAALGRALSVVAMCPSGVGPAIPPPPPPPRAIVPLMPVVLRSTRFRRRVLGSVIAHPERAPLRGLVHYSRTMATASGFRSTLYEVNRHRFSDWHAIDAPVTLAWGEHDTQICPIPPPVPGVRSEILSDCGHAGPVWDNPDEVVRVLLSASDAATRAEPNASTAGAPVLAAVLD